MGIFKFSQHPQLSLKGKTNPSSTTEFIKFSFWTFGIRGPLLRCRSLPLLIFCWESAHWRQRVGGPIWAFASRLEPFLRICSGERKGGGEERDNLTFDNVALRIGRLIFYRLNGHVFTLKGVPSSTRLILVRL